MSIKIRTENYKDHEVVYDLIAQAFKTAKKADGHEQDFYENLKKNECFIPDLALVAEKDGKIIGQVLLTRFAIKHSDNTVHQSLLLAPVAILEEYRGQGVGSALIYDSFKRARKLGFDSIFLVGDPAYYKRFGFRPTTDFSTQCQDDIPAQYIQAIELKPNALKKEKGSITFMI